MTEDQEKWVGHGNGKGTGRQVGGRHYIDFLIQPVEFITINKLGFLEGCIIKRICRYNREGGKGLADLEKIHHEIELIVELAMGGTPAPDAMEPEASDDDRPDALRWINYPFPDFEKGELKS